jgi:hypothetical protein
LINKKTKIINNRILFTKPIPNTENYESDLNNIADLLNMLGHSKSSQEVKLKINKINKIIGQKNIRVKTKNLCSLLKKSR